VLNGLIRLVETLQGNPLSLPVFVATFLLFCAMGPISLFAVAGGVLFGFRWGLVINLATECLGATGPFWVARLVARKKIFWWLRKKGYGKTLRVLRKPNLGVLILLRLVGFPPFLMYNYLLGISRVKYRDFLWTTFVGIAPATFVMTYFSGTFWAILKEAGMDGFKRAMLNHLFPVLLGGMLLVVLLVAAGVAKRWVMGGREAS